MPPAVPRPPRALHPVRAYRVRRGVAQADLAQRAGISDAGLSRIETGSTELPSIPVIHRLVMACEGEVSAVEIFRHHLAAGNPNKKRKPPTRQKQEPLQ